MPKHAAVVSAAVLSAVATAGALIVFQDAYELPRVDLQVSAAPVLEALSPEADAPEAPVARGADAAVTKAKDGHFWAEANVEGRRVRFLVDTGATTVALTAADAQRLGIDAKRLDFSHPVKTAAGEVRAALVELDYISVAGARVDKVQALVMEKGLETSLLGMSYLGRLSRLEATRDSMILRS